MKISRKRETRKWDKKREACRREMEKRGKLEKL
jgi:hypothetical protein